MRKSRFNRRTFGFSRNRGLLFAVAVAIGISFFMITIFNGSPAVTTKVQAAGQNFRGGATAEMLAYALDLRGGAQYAVYGGRGVRNNGNSTFRGNVGSSGSVLGVPGLSDARGGNDNGTARQDLQNAIGIINQLPCEQVDDSSLTGKTFTPGVYCLSSADLAGMMTLNGGGDPNAFFVFRVNGSLSAGDGSVISLDDGAKATNTYFVANGDITVGTGGDINSNLLSAGSITVGDSSRISGKTLSSSGNVVVTNSVLGAGTGSVEICKFLAPGETTIPAGTIFTFNVSGLANAIQVPAGACSAPFDVAAGSATVTEAVRANTAVVAISVSAPNQSRLTSFSLGLRQAVLNIPEGNINDQTVVNFTNQTTRTGTLEICKQGLDSGVTGMFQFTVQGAPGQTFAVPVGFCSNPITTTIVQQPGTPFTANVTELARANFRLENVTTFPSNRLNGPFVPNQGFDADGNPITNTNGGFANVVLISGGGPAQATIVNFFNRSLPGRIKVCKITADPTNIPVGTSFRFTVTGTVPTSPTQTLPGVPNTQFTVDVPAGPASQGGFCQFVDAATFVVDTPVTITEIGLSPGVTLPNGLTFADTRVSRIRANPGPLLSSNLTTRTATINAVNNTAEIEFTNFIFRPAILKICKIAGTGVTAGTNFTFNLALVDPLTSLPVTTAPITVPAGSCSIVSGPFPSIEAFPGVGTFNFNTQIVVTEAAAAGVQVTAITSPSGGPLGGVSFPNRTATLTLNQMATAGNINEIAVTNSTAPAPLAARYDFDGDHKSDAVIFRPSTATWWYEASATGQILAAQWGAANDKLVAADYDGDGKTDLAVYRAGTWHVFGTSTGYTATQFGVSTDIPVTGDFDGDGKADFVVYRPSEGVWYMQLSRDGFRAVQFGISTDIPVAADYDGDGKMDPAVYRNGTWYILGSSAGFSAFQFGISTDLPVPADYDGDGHADAAVFRNGDWYLLQSTAGFAAFPWGTTGDVPVPADYDGDGKTDASVYRPSTNVWYMTRSTPTTGGSFASFPFGSTGDQTLPY